MKPRFAIIFMLLVALSSRAAYPAIELSLKGSFPGYASGVANAVQTVGGLAYVAVGEGGIAILNIANPTHPVRVGGYDTENYTSGVAVVGSLLYLADHRGGLVILDVSNSSNPTRIGGYKTPNFFASAVAIAGPYAYVASVETATNGNSNSDQYGLHILDITNPATPALVSRFDGRSSSVGGLALGSNNVVYLCLGYNGLAVIDVADRTAPREIARVPASDFAVRVTICGNKAFMASRAAGLEIFDVTFPGRPIRLGRYDSRQTYDVVVRGNYAFATDLDEGLEVIDITSPAAPILIGRLNVPGSASALALANEYACVAAGTGGLRLIDASDPTRPTPIGAFDSYWYIHQVVVDRDSRYAYVADFAALQIFDVRVASQPLRIGNIPTSGQAIDLAMTGQYLYVVEGRSGLEIFDLANPEAPSQVGWSASWPAVGIALSGDRAYLAGGESWDKNGLQVLDISNPGNPTMLGSLLWTGNCQQVTVSGPYAYLADQNAGLRIVDITFPLLPKQVGSYQPEPPVYSYDVAVSSNRAFLAADALRIVDVSSPSAPTLIARSGPYNAPSVALLSQYALITDYSSSPSVPGGLRAFSITNPAVPVQLASYEAMGFEKLFAAGNLAYVANASKGLTILDLGPSFAVPPLILSHPTEHAIRSGSSVTLEVLANGTQPLAYQWQLNGTNLIGATGSRLTLTNVSLGNVGKYSVEVGNSLGMVRSSDALVSLVQPPIIISWTPDQTVSAGSDVTFDVIAQGTKPLRYQWTFFGTNLQSSTDSPLKLKDVQTGDAGLYFLAVENMAGKATNFIRLTVTSAPPTVVLQPQSVDEITGVQVTFGTESRGSNPLSYQWEFNGAPLPGQTAEDLVLDRVEPEDAGVYRLRVTNAFGQAISDAALLRVQVMPDFNAAIGHPGTNQTSANGIAIDNDANVFVTGQFYGRGVFGNTNVTARNGDMFLAKFDSSSNLLWVRTLGEFLPQLGGGPDTATRVAVDGQDDAYVAGSFWSDSQLPPSFYFRGAYLAKYYANGQLAWLQPIWDFDSSGAAGTNSVAAVRIDRAGNILVIGSYEHSAAFDVDETLTNAGGSDIFVAKYSPQADLLWVRRAGGPGDDKGFGLDCDQDDNVYLSGIVSFATNPSNAPAPVYFGSLSLSNTGTTLFVAKCDENGNFLWVTNARSLAPDGTIVAQSLVTDAHGYAYIAGIVTPPAVFGNTNLPALPFYSLPSAFVAKYGPQGDCLWVRQIPAASGGAWASVITADPAGNLFLGGKFYGEIFFGDRSFISQRGDGPDISFDGWIASYDFSGRFVWARAFGGIDDDALTDIVLNKNGDAYLSGFYTTRAAFGDVQLSSRHSDPDAYIARIDYATAPTAPRLSVSRSGTLLEIAWPAAAAGFDLQTFDALGNAALVDPLSSSSNAVRRAVVVPALQPVQWFRLIKP